ncbi:Glucose-1-phosphate adenylyltransferase (EC 2.7.7.27), partial [Candidatus Synechococcus spongiarum]
FSFYDENFPIYTRPRYLPPTKLLDSHVTESILGDGSILKDCSIHKCVLGVRSRIESGAVLQDTLTMGSDYYESNGQRDAMRAKGSIPLGVGAGSTVKGAILDKNVRIGDNVQLINKDHIEDADRPELGFYIRSNLVIVIKNATIPNNMVI